MSADGSRIVISANYPILDMAAMTTRLCETVWRVVPGLALVENV